MDRAGGLFAVAALVAVLLLAGCGTAGTPAATAGGGAATPATFATPPTATTPPSTAVAASPPTVPGSPAAGGVTVTPGPSGLTVTLADDGRTVELAVGQSFLLALGSDLDWTVNVADMTVVSRVVNITVVRGAQGVYVAKAPGETTLTATGDPPCRKATPPCAAPSRSFRVTVVVRPASATPTP